MKKNICFIIESMGGGGAQKNLYRLIKTLQKENVSISLITFKKNEKDRFFFRKKLVDTMQKFLCILIIY